MEDGIWWDKSIKIVEGCTKVSAGCENCWALAMEDRFGNGFSVHVDRMQRALKRRKPTTFTIWNDLFHDGVTDAQIDQVMEAIESTSRHKYMILTKRPERMKNYMSDYASLNGILENLTIGVSIEDQQTADQRIPLLLNTPAHRRFVSFEPALGIVNLGLCLNCMPGGYENCYEHAKLDLVIMGGESGPKARPMHPDWARSVRDQCAEANVPFNFKQWGEWWSSDQGQWLSEAERHVNFDGPDQDHYRIGKKAAGRLLDGVEHNGEIIW